MNKLASFLCLAIFPIFLFGQQTIVNDTIPRTAVIGFDINGNQVSYNPETPPLNQIAGAPKAFYTYFWEFGDGNYSFEEKPTHTYKKQGEFETRLWTTNNYDNGKAPVARPKLVSISETPSTFEDLATLDAHHGFRLQRNREPMPDQEMVVVISYKNEKSYVASGKMYLFYNEKKFKQANFELLDTRTHHGERIIKEETIASAETMDHYHSHLASLKDELLLFKDLTQDTINRTNLPLTLEESKAMYGDWSLLEFDDMEPGEERSIFHTIKTTPEMIKDTSAIVSLRGVYIPDRSYDDHKVKEMEMEIVTSHDPNKMSTKNWLMNYRFVRFKRVGYKIRFQNNGEGPARTIRLETDIPDMFDKSSLQVEDMYPKCKICPKKEVNYSCLDTMFTDKQVIFTFKNIYLPGSNMKKEVAYDSTQGFVKYSIKFGKDFHKKKTKSRTAIFFDKNEPILTNYSVTRFMPGISIGARMGYNYYPKLENSRSYFVGATISPFKSYKSYWQSEITVGTQDFRQGFSAIQTLLMGADVPVGFGDEIFRTNTSETRVEKVNLAITPISYRYTLNNFIGFGVGPEVALDISNRIITNDTNRFFLAINQRPAEEIEALFEQEEFEENKPFSDIRARIFADITLGAARIGPSVGVRYVQDLEGDQNNWQFYAIWKF